MRKFFFYFDNKLNGNDGPRIEIENCAGLMKEFAITFLTMERRRRKKNEISLFHTDVKDYIFVFCRACHVLPAFRGSRSLQ